MDEIKFKDLEGDRDGKLYPFQKFFNILFDTYGVTEIEDENNEEYWRKFETDFYNFVMTKGLYKNGRLLKILKFFLSQKVRDIYDEKKAKILFDDDYPEAHFYFCLFNELIFASELQVGTIKELNMESSPDEYEKIIKPVFFSELHRTSTGVTLQLAIRQNVKRAVKKLGKIYAVPFPKLESKDGSCNPVELV